MYCYVLLCTCLGVLLRVAHRGGACRALPCVARPGAQAWIGRARLESFSLTADMMYVSQNAPRIMRAVFEICLRCGGCGWCGWGGEGMRVRWGARVVHGTARRWLYMMYKMAGALEGGSLTCEAATC